MTTLLFDAESKRRNRLSEIGQAHGEGHGFHPAHSDPLESALSVAYVFRWPLAWVLSMDAVEFGLLFSYASGRSLGEDIRSRR